MSLDPPLPGVNSKARSSPPPKASKTAPDLKLISAPFDMICFVGNELLYKLLTLAPSSKRVAGVPELLLALMYQELDVGTVPLSTSPNNIEASPLTDVRLLGS